jgi:hypothetical protein
MMIVVSGFVSTVCAVFGFAKQPKKKNDIKKM